MCVPLLGPFALRTLTRPKLQCLPVRSGLRNTYEDSNCILRPVDDYSLFTGFSCGKSDLDDFFVNDAKPHDEQLLAKTYSFHLKDNGQVSDPVAFCSMSNDAIRISNRKRQRLFAEGKRYKTYPAVKIGRLGTRQNLKRRSIGTYLLWALRFLFITDNRTGCRFVTVDAYNEPGVIQFYQKNDFAFLTTDDAHASTRAMFCDLLRFKHSLPEAT